MEFWREFVEDGACCDRVSLGELERWEPGKLRASPSPRRAAGSGAAARLASGGSGGCVACAERGGVWRCAAPSASPWLGLRRVRAGGGGEAGECGRECGRERGARRRRARRAPPAGSASQPHSALFLGAVVASSLGRCLRPRALCLPRLPPATLYPRPFVSPPWALCPTHRAPHPFSIASAQLSFLPCPFVVSHTIR